MVPGYHRPRSAPRLHHTLADDDGVGGPIPESASYIVDHPIDHINLPIIQFGVIGVRVGVVYVDSTFESIWGTVGNSHGTPVGMDFGGDQVERTQRHQLTKGLLPFVYNFQ